jgi:dienelactone hydrolase
MANLTKLPSKKRFDAAVAKLSALVLTACLAVVLAIPCNAAVSWSRLKEPWPDPDSVQGMNGISVSWPSKSPFVPQDIGTADAAPPTTAMGRLYMPLGPHRARSVPAVVLLHGSGGVLSTRELTYAPQLSKMGVAALVVDVFGARRDRGTEFIERLLNITETMMAADAYSGLGFLARRPEIDPHRVVLVGFSYGAMATTLALFVQIADALAPPDLRFAGHVAFYGPCIVRFADSRTTGAPLLMLIGGSDEIVDQTRCEETAGDLRA